MRLRELDTHEVTCEFRSLMCDLCDEEGEDEESRPPGKSAAQGGTSALLGADGDPKQTLDPRPLTLYNLEP